MKNTSACKPIGDSYFGRYGSAATSTTNVMITARVNDGKSVGTLTVFP